MTEANPITNGGMWRSHLEAALAKPGETVILASLDDKRGMVMQAATVRPQDLVDAARSLLEQAKDRLEDDQIDDEHADMLERLNAALDELPDPNADD